jgi:hypothetical protein
MTNDDFEDPRLSRLLRSVTAEPDDTAFHLALARLAAANQPPRWLAWVLRPAALGTAAILLVCTAGASYWWLNRGVDNSSLSDSVMAAAGASSQPDLDDSENTPTAPAGARTVTDTGGLQ